MSSSSDLAGGAPETAPTGFVVTDRLIARRVRAGVLVRRWDRDDDAVLLNESAWTVVVALGANPGPTEVGALTVAVAELVQVPVEEVGDLAPILRGLIDRHLVGGPA